jgi:aminopeptidase N
MLLTINYRYACEVCLFLQEILFYMSIKISALLLFFCFFVSSAQDNSKKLSYTNAALYEKEFELIHTKLEVSFDIPQEILFGKEWLTLSPYFYAANKLTLDAKGMTIHEISSDGKILNFQYRDEKIYIDLVRLYKKEDSLELYIEYTADPSKVKQKGSSAITAAKGLYFINPKALNKDKSTQIWTQGETESSSCWFPTIDSPNQKTTQEIYIRVPDKYKTLSNGLLKSQQSHRNGERTDYWAMNQKHAPYLFFIGVGEFSIVKDEWRGKEISYYVEKEYEELARDIFGKTPKMIDFFSEITGVPYVWDKYSQIVVRDFVSGAMENTTAVVHGEGAYQSKGDLVDGNVWESVIAHELFHHWFGDLVTMENWSNVSLNESFANYSEYLWLLHEYGEDRAEEHRIKSVEAYKNGANKFKNLVRFDYENREDVFDLVSYNKGGAVLHMLKNYIGEEAFFAGLKLYLQENKFSTAEVPQLRMAFEKVSGKDLNWFFEQWFYGSGHPNVKVTHDYNVLEKTVTVTLRQQSGEFYFPLLIEIHEDGAKTQKELFVDSVEKSFTFSYDEYPDWIHIDANHIVLADFIQNYTLRDYKFQFKNATHFEDRKAALTELVKHQDDKKIFEMVVSAFDDPNYQVQILALDKIDLSGKHTKRKVIAKIEEMAKIEKNNLVKATAIKILGRLVYFDYQDFFEKSFNDQSNKVKGAALEGLYYLNKEVAIAKAKQLPGNVKETIAYPLSKIYIEERDVSEMTFVSRYVIQGMYLSNSEETKNVFKAGFQWVSRSNNVAAYKNMTADMISKGKQYKKYKFHEEAIRLMRTMVTEQDKLKNSNKKELISVVNQALVELMKV